MEFVQKKKANRHTFTFHDDYITFTYEDKSGSGGIDTNFADFPQKSSVQIERNDWLRNAGYLWMVIGVLQLSYAIYSKAPLSGKGFWLVVGLGCFIWAHFSKVKYTVFRVEQGNVFVIQNKQHDRIIDEINARRKSQLKKWYAQINPESPIESEINKFKWLAEQGVISREEAEQKIALAEIMKKDDFQLPGERLN